MERGGNSYNNKDQLLEFLLILFLYGMLNSSNLNKNSHILL